MIIRDERRPTCRICGRGSQRSASPNWCSLLLSPRHPAPEKGPTPSRSSGTRRALHCSGREARRRFIGVGHVAAADLVRALAAVEQPEGRQGRAASGGRRSEPSVDRHEHHAVSSQLARSGTARSARAGTCPGRRRVPARELDSGSASGSGFTGAAPRSRRATGTARRADARSIRLDAWRGASRRQRPPRSRSRSRPGADPGTRRPLPRAPRA